jgi:SET domain-containing protein
MAIDKKIACFEYPENARVRESLVNSLRNTCLVRRVISLITHISTDSSHHSIIKLIILHLDSTNKPSPMSKAWVNPNLQDGLEFFDHQV